MSVPSQSQLDINTLGWVKSEIDDTLNQARSALETYVETPDDESQLRFCINYLHQVHGTLQMVELYGASMVAEEMEKLTEALLENRVNAREDAYEVLMRGILQLPDYLERLQNGARDMPVLLLPLLNDLRAARGEALLTENALFQPDLSVEAPTVAPLAEETEDLPHLASKLRHAYHLGLLGWFRETDTDGSLNQIQQVIDKLRKSANDNEANRMFWVASGVVEGLRDGGLESSVAVKLLLGNVDRQIKRIIDHGEEALNDSPPTELLKNLLYYVSCSRSQGELVTELKKAFGLSEALPDRESLEKARADMTGPNAELMKTVSAVLIDDLTKVKDGLDLFVRSESRDLGSLRGLADTLNQMSDTLGMLGLGVQRKEILDQAAVLNDMIEGKREIEENVLMDMAASLLAVEGALGDLSTARVVNEEADNTDAVATSVDISNKQLMKSVLKEVAEDMVRIKEALTDFSRTPSRPDLLEKVPQYMAQIQGGLSMLDLEQASELLSIAGRYIEQELIPGKLAPEDSSLDVLADAISSIEYYLESLMEGWGHPDSILQVAQQSLTQLGILSDTEYTAPTETPADDRVEALDHEEKTKVDIELGELPDSLAGEETDYNDDTLTDIPMPDGEVDASAETLTDLSDELESAGSEEMLLDIPLEEDGLELDLGEADTAELKAPEFETPQSESEGLVIGEGPGAGPEEDTVVDLSPVNDSSETRRGIGSEEFRIEGMDDLSDLDLDALASGEIPVSAEEAAALEASTSSADIAPAMSSARSAQPASVIEEIDDEIIEIFLEEAEEEYGNISRLLPRWVADQNDMESLKELRRSFHTLKGSGRLVGALDLGEFAWACENMLNRVIDKTIEPTPVISSLLEKARAMLPALFDNFRNGTAPDHHVFHLMEMAHAISQGKDVSEDMLVAPPADETAGVTAEAESEPEPEPAAEASDLDTGLQVLETEIERIEEEVSVAPAPQPATGEAEAGGFLIPDIDPGLRQIYSNEAEVHLKTLREYIFNARIMETSEVTPELLRALHTLSGSSRTTGMQPIAALSGLFEKYVKLQSDVSAPMHEHALDILEDYVEYVATAVDQIGTPGQPLDDNSALLERIQELYDQAAAEHSAVDIDASAVSRATETTAEPAAVPQEYDEELLEIFLEEGTEILEESDHTLHGWVAEPDNGEFIEALQRQLHTLKGGARMAGVTEIGDLSHSIETLLTAVVDGRLQPTPAMFDLLLKAQDREVSMLEQLRQRQPITPATDLIRQLDTIASGGELSVEEAVPVNDTPVAEESPPELVEEDETDSLAMEREDLTEEIELDLSEAPPGFSLDSEESSSEPELTGATSEELELNVPAEESGERAEAETVAPPAGNVVPLDARASEPAPAPEEPPAPPAPAAESAPAVEKETQRAVVRPQGEQIRVRADLVDDLVNFAGEVSIYRSRLEQQNNTFRYNLQELDDTVTRLREQLRKFEIEAEAQIQHRFEETTGRSYEDFDPLEFDRFTMMQQLSRGMMESLNDLDSLRTILANLTRESETLLLQQSRVNTELQEGLMRTRMVPFSNQVPRLRRIARQTSQELGKNAELHIHGMDNELDRSVLERVLAPLEHMLRNAIAHGIESPEQRREAGKKENGQINLHLDREGNDLVITLRDDGAGIDVDAIRATAIDRGLLDPDASPDKNELLELIMESGFSTATEVTQISGRGVGMDVVSSEIKKLGGVLQIDTEKGKGTTFTVRLPQSLSVTRALLVHVADETYAIPLLGVEGVERVSGDVIAKLQQSEKQLYKWVGQDYRYLHLAATLGLAEAHIPDPDARVPLLLVRSGDFRAAIQVDGLVGSREVVVKPVGPQLSTMRGISGATIMGDGGVVLILDLGALVRMVDFAESTEADIMPVAPTEEEAAEAKKPLVMVVDDSITVRKVTTRLLERNDMEVVTAKDGVDALAQLQEVRPDIMLLDIEMPRMDGFELATNMRNDAELEHIPIIMITSRTGEKHRDRALSIGVNRYMGKPFQETDLIENISALLAESN
ncbi:MAG TPA: response regulator [Gammaproteobacteria bacterium]|nr:response regulator [Gammaproteobacteria bacterium]